MKPTPNRNKTAASPPGLTCPHCGSARNSRGEPFNEGTLLLHVRKSHPEQKAAEEPEKPANALSCDICGAWRSRRGGVFLSEEAVRRHVGIAHRNGRAAIETESHQTGNGSSAATRTNRKSHIGGSAPVKFCPQCGCNLEVVAAALSFIQ